MRPYLLDWPTTNYEDSLKQYAHWVTRIGEILPGVGRLMRVDWAMGSWALDVTDYGQLVDAEYDFAIKENLERGKFPDFLVNVDRSVTLPRLD